jgi:hypothetical protein
VVGRLDMPRLMASVASWAAGSWLEKRAVVAGLCEPALLRDRSAAGDVLDVLDAITESMAAATSDGRSEDFRVLRQALAYAWSVAVAADPAAGKPLLERWLRSADRDASWMARENFKKDRLKRMDPAWVEYWTTR